MLDMPTTLLIGPLGLLAGFFIGYYFFRKEVDSLINLLGKKDEVIDGLVKRIDAIYIERKKHDSKLDPEVERRIERRLSSSLRPDRGGEDV